MTDQIRSFVVSINFNGKILKIFKKASSCMPILFSFNVDNTYDI